MILVSENMKHLIPFKGRIEIDKLDINYIEKGFSCTLYSAKNKSELAKELLQFCISITNKENIYKFGE